MKRTLHTTRAVTIVAALGALVSVAFAQGTPQAMIGGAVPAPGPPNIIQQQVWCNNAVQLCPVPLPPPPTPFAGGTAYDSRQQVIWDTEGIMITSMRATNPPCRILCPPTPLFPAGAPLATGLALDDRGRTLWVLDSSPALTAHPVPPPGVCPQPRFSCSLAPYVPANFMTGGLAFSEKHNFVWYAASDFSGVLGTMIFGSIPPAGPGTCPPPCRFPLPPCPDGTTLGPVTGLAYDDCKDELYVTDGKLTMRINVLPNCQPMGVQCCTAPVLGPYYGLALEKSHAVTIGVSCLTTPPCPVCPTMALTATGDPTIGNAAFALNITGAPGGIPAVGLLGSPNCTLGVPIFCGSFYPPLVGLFTLPGVVTAGAGCAGTATIPLPIPNNYALCGGPLCVQAVVVCPGPGVGLTNALDITITDN